MDACPWAVAAQVYRGRSAAIKAMRRDRAPRIALLGVCS
jgi:hypothetical protein